MNKEELIEQLAEKMLESLRDRGNYISKETALSLSNIAYDFYNNQIEKLELTTEDIQSEECPICYRIKGKNTSECDYCSWNVMRI